LTGLKNVLADRWSQLHNEMVAKQRAMFEKPMSSMELRKVQSMGATTQTVSGAPLTRMASLQPNKSAPATAAVPLAQSNPFEGMLITTEDAHTLTDGPTIYLAENVENVGKFLIKNANIPPKVLESVMRKIEYNNAIQRKMEKIMVEIEAKEKKTTDKNDKDKKDSQEKASSSREIAEMTETVNSLREQIVLTNVDSVYIPNTRDHQKTWIKGDKKVPNAFVSSIDDASIREIMGLSVSSQFKLLLLLGIGMFIKDDNKEYTEYMEVMKRLATGEKLFLIIASSDYIYGTNYQFSHGFIGKDLVNMTQQKAIQGMGRVGRGNVQNTYTIRFRDNDVIRRLFLPAERNLEAEKMSTLLVSSS